MILKKLVLYNFRQYIGQQEIEFSTDSSKNVTVLIGVNTSGKTTIIRAFEWCLYNKLGFEDPILLNSEVRDNMNEGDVQETWVEVSFYHDNKLYTLRRTIKYQCISKTRQNDKVMVSFGKHPDEELTLHYLQNDGQTKTPIDKSNITESMNRVLPKDLSDYFFFGGERISSIANRTDLSKAIRGLMRLDVLENASSHLSKVIKGFEANIDTTGDSRAEKAKDGLITATNQKTALLDERVNSEKQMQYWKQKEIEYNNDLLKSSFEVVKIAKERRDQINAAIKNEETREQNAINEMIEIFNTRPYSFFGMPAIKKTLEVLADIKEATECVPGMDQDSIDYLLNRGYCICGTKLDKGTIPEQRLLAERRKLPPEHIGAVVNNYKNKSEGYLAGSEDFCEKITTKFKSIRTIQRNIGLLKDELDDQVKIIADEKHDGKDIEQNRKQAEAEYLAAKSDYDQITAKIGGCDRDISNYQKTIDAFAKNSSKNAKVARYIMYSQKVYDWLDDTYKQKEQIVRTEIQKRVNSNFLKMYHGVRTIIIDEKYRVKYSDVTTEESDGLKAVKSFAFIASLVSMAKDKILDDQELKLGQVYPLVMDAPFSNVDEIHIDKICKILPTTANQVIMAVMQKDWEYAEANLKNFVGKSYIIQKDSDDDGKEIDTITHIKEKAV